MRLKSIFLIIGLLGLLLFSLSFLGHSDSITDAKLKRLENDTNRVTAAIFQYVDKYRALPGDINGNGRIEGAFDSNQPSAESRLLWLHLRQAGLFPGNPSLPLS